MRNANVVARAFGIATQQWALRNSARDQREGDTLTWNANVTARAFGIATQRRALQSSARDQRERDALMRNTNVVARAFFGIATREASSERSGTPRGLLSGSATALKESR